ncbi:MAG: flavin reductase family protein [Eubacteriales bacterium]
MKKCQLNDVAGECIEKLKRGAFLTVKGGNKINTMTIGWGFVGIMWKKPTVITAVRKSRYSNRLMQEAKDYTISFPSTDALKKELAFCGSKSGRDVDKFKETGLNIMPSYHVDSPIIKECNLFIEAKLVYRQEMDENLFYEQEQMAFYPTGVDHIYYFGEIVDIYQTNE